MNETTKTLTDRDFELAIRAILSVYMTCTKAQIRLIGYTDKEDEFNCLERRSDEHWRLYEKLHKIRNEMVAA